MAQQGAELKLAQQDSNKTTSSDNMIYKTDKEGLSRVKEGNVVEEYKIGNTRVKICDDYFRERTEADIKAILARISERAQKQLSAQEALKE